MLCRIAWLDPEQGSRNEKVSPAGALRSCRFCVLPPSCAISPVAADPLVFEPAIDPGVGFNLIAWSGNSGSSWTNAMNALFAAGFREVSISPVRRFDNNTGGVLSILVSVIVCRRGRRGAG